MPEPLRNRQLIHSASQRSTEGPSSSGVLSRLPESKSLKSLPSARTNSDVSYVSTVQRPKFSVPTPLPRPGVLKAPPRPRISSELDTGTKPMTTHTDYRVPDNNRSLEVRVANRSLFIDPKAVRDVSPQVSAFLLREYAAGNRSSVEPKLEDLNYEDVLEAVRAVCPTDYGLFATPVTATTFSTLARMSRAFQVPKLRNACELYVARLPLTLADLTAPAATQMLHDSFKYGLNGRAKVRLLQAVIWLTVAEDAVPINDASAAATASWNCRNTDTMPAIGNLIEMAMDEHKRGRLRHSQLLDEARLKVPCRVCRMEEPPPPKTAAPTSDSVARAQLQVCGRCRQTTCPSCATHPCATLVTELMERFANAYEG